MHSDRPAAAALARAALIAAEVSEARTSGLLLCACNQRPHDQPRAHNRDQRAATHGPARRILRFDSIQEGRNDRQPDQRHGHLVEDGWRESSRRLLLAGAGRVGRTGLLDYLVRSGSWSSPAGMLAPAGPMRRRSRRVSHGRPCGQYPGSPPDALRPTSAPPRGSAPRSSQAGGVQIRKPLARLRWPALSEVDSHSSAFPNEP